MRWPRGLVLGCHHGRPGFLAAGPERLHRGGRDLPRLRRAPTEGCVEQAPLGPTTNVGAVPKQQFFGVHLVGVHEAAGSIRPFEGALLKIRGLFHSWCVS